MNTKKHNDISSHSKVNSSLIRFKRHPFYPPGIVHKDPSLFAAALRLSAEGVNTSLKGESYENDLQGTIRNERHSLTVRNLKAEIDN